MCNSHRRLDRKLTIEKHSLQWSLDFNKEKRRIEGVVLELSLDKIAIEHVGSTSVKDIKSKPTIDILIGYYDDLQESILTGILVEKLGYYYIEEMKTRFPKRSFFYFGSVEKHTYHIHLVKYGDRDWLELTCFRNYLSKCKESKAMYERAKINSLRNCGNSIKKYSDGKRDVYEEILKRAMSTC